MNVADQEAISQVLPLAKERMMGVVAKRPLANVVWANVSIPVNGHHRVYWSRLRALQYDFLNVDSNTVSPVAVALNFTLAQYVHVALVGTRSPLRYLENAKLLDTVEVGAGQISAIRARWSP